MLKNKKRHASRRKRAVKGFSQLWEKLKLESCRKLNLSFTKYKVSGSGGNAEG